MKAKISKTARSIMITLVIISMILGYSKISHGNENLEITNIVSFSKIDSSNKLMVTDYRDGEFKITFFSEKANGVPHQTKFNLFDLEGNKYTGEVDKKNEIYNTFRVESEKHLYRCYIIGFFDNPSSIPYQKFDLKTFSKQDRLVKKVSGTMHEFNVSLDTENNQLQLKNVCNKDISVTNIAADKWVEVINDQTNIKIAPGETYSIDLKLNTTDLDRTVGTIKDLITIQYQVGQETLENKIELAINTVCLIPEECPTCKAGVCNVPSADIKATVGISDLGDGQYQIGMALENQDQHQRFIKLIDYDITLTDIYGNKHNLQTKKKQIRYAEECAKGKLSDEECLVTIVGKIDSSDTTYESYTVKITYRDENGEEKTRSFSDKMPELKIVEQKINLDSSNTGNYTLTLKK